MKRFKDFKQKAILIKAVPSHGSHAISALNEAVHKDYEVIHSVWHDVNDNIHIGKNTHEIEDSLHDDGVAVHPQFEHLKSYSDFSTTINKSLIHKAQGKDYWDKENHPYLNAKEIEQHKASNKKIVEGIDKLINTSPRLSREMTVYHGVDGFHPGKEAAKHSEGHIHLPGYTSTSIDKKVASRFSGGNSMYTREHGHHILAIKLPKGHKGVYVGPHSQFPEEHEMLLPRDMKLKIHPKPTVIENTIINHKAPESRKTEQKKIHVWHAEPV